MNWAKALTGSIGGNGGWFYDLLRKAGMSPGPAHTLVEFVLRPLEVVLVLLGAWLVARLGSRAVRRLVTKMGTQAATRSVSPRAAARVQTTAAVTANIWRFLIAILAIAIILGMLGIDLTPVLASATIIGATLGFGAQQLVRDYLSGFLLTVEDQFGIGDSISVNTITGTVEDVSLRVTKVRVQDGSVVYLPNGDIRALTNASRGWAKAVVDVTVPVTSAAALARATAAAREAAERVAAQAPAAAAVSLPPEVLGLVGTADTGGVLRVRLQTTPGHRNPLERALRTAVMGAVADAVADDEPGAEEAEATPG